MRTVLERCFEPIALKTYYGKLCSLKEEHGDWLIGQMLNGVEEAKELLVEERVQVCTSERQEGEEAERKEVRGGKIRKNSQGHTKWTRQRVRHGELRRREEEIEQEREMKNGMAEERGEEKQEGRESSRGLLPREQAGHALASLASSVPVGLQVDLLHVMCVAPSPLLPVQSRVQRLLAPSHPRCLISSLRPPLRQSRLPTLRALQAQQELEKAGGLVPEAQQHQLLARPVHLHALERELDATLEDDDGDVLEEGGGGMQEAAAVELDGGAGEPEPFAHAADDDGYHHLAPVVGHPRDDAQEGAALLQQALVGAMRDEVLDDDVIAFARHQLDLEVSAVCDQPPYRLHALHLYRGVLLQVPHPLEDRLDAAGLGDDLSVPVQCRQIPQHIEHRNGR
eukprot:712236-Hanusia_phi.AAC.2